MTLFHNKKYKLLQEQRKEKVSDISGSKFFHPDLIGNILTNKTERIDKEF